MVARAAAPVVWAGACCVEELCFLQDCWGGSGGKGGGGGGIGCDVGVAWCGRNAVWDGVGRGTPVQPRASSACASESAANLARAPLRPPSPLAAPAQGRAWVRLRFRRAFLSPHPAVDVKMMQIEAVLRRVDRQCLRVRQCLPSRVLLAQKQPAPIHAYPLPPAQQHVMRVYLMSLRRCRPRIHDYRASAIARSPYTTK